MEGVFAPASNAISCLHIDGELRLCSRACATESIKRPIDCHCVVIVFGAISCVAGASATAFLSALLTQRGYDTGAYVYYRYRLILL